ncbi:beta strand repeat-containing protein, partial [Hymenobacter persicinus]
MTENNTLFRRQAPSGSGRWRFLLQLRVLLGLPLLGHAQTLTQADFTGVVVPQYLGSGTATRLPVLYRATVSNLTPNTLYRYFTQAATNATTGGGTVDFGTTSGGAGNPLLINNASGTYTYYTGSVNLATAGSYETFMTDAAGSFTGWFGFVNTGNARFTGGNVVFPTITLGKDATSSVVEKRLALNQGMTVLTFAATAGAPNGTFIKGNSFATPRNLVAIYDNTAGSGRPLAVTVVEPISATIASTVPGYSTTSGSWNTIVPNANANGVQRVEERSVTTGAVVNCNTDADGTWPSGVVTANPTGGTTPLQLTSTDAPLNAGCGAVGTPTITVSTNGPLTFATTTGTPSAAQTYTVAGTNLTADITVTAPAGYQISSNGSAYSTTLTLTQTNGTVATTTISVRLQGTANGTFTGNITNVSGSAAQNVAVSGTVGSSGPAAPTVTSFTPASGPVGTVVTVTGTDFTGTTAVTIGGTNAPNFTVNSNTQLVVTVPAGASSGIISVTTPAGTGSSSTNFIVTAPTPPTIASFTPTSGPVGTTVTITGTNFTGATAVTFNGTLATTFSVVNATTISANVPVGATTGPIAVTTPDGTATSGTNFTVTASAPTIASFTPASGPVGTTVTITGTNFTGATAVTFNGTTATSFNVVSATSVTAVVPAGATTGAIAVTTPGGTATSATSFTVTVPTAAITALSPAVRVANSAGFTLTVSGTSFQSGAVVTLNGTALTTTFVSATSLTAAVPASALTTPGTYNVTVTNPGATASAPATFTVSAAMAGLFEDFEQGTKTGYASATVALQSGDWTLADALIGTSTSDKFNGTRSVRVRGGGSVSMNFDKPNGAGTITLNAALYGTDTGVSLKLEISTDGGTTYTDITGTAPTLTASLAPYTFTANRPGNIRIRVSSTNTVAASNPRLNLDDISITDYTAPATPVITVTPASLPAFSTTTGTPSAAQSFTVSASNLTADLTVTAPAGYEVSLSQATGFAASVSLTPASGTVASTTVYVRLTGAASGSFAGNVAVTSAGATTQNVAVTGTVTTPTPPAPTIASFTPASGPVGTTVTITGTNFTGATAVTFNGTTATS